MRPREPPSPLEMRWASAACGCDPAARAACSCPPKVGFVWRRGSRRTGGVPQPPAATLASMSVTLATVIIENTMMNSATVSMMPRAII